MIYKVFQDFLIVSCFVYIAFENGASEEVVIAICSFALLGITWHGVQMFRRRKQLLINLHKKILITPQMSISFHGSKALEFFETFLNLPDGGVRIYSINLILLSGVSVGLLDVDLKQEAKKIFKVIHEVIKVDTAHKIERGLLGGVTKKGDFI